MLIQGLPTYLGILLVVDASIKAVIIEIDKREYGKYIIQELDDEHVLVHKDMLDELKGQIRRVGGGCKSFLKSSN